MALGVNASTDTAAQPPPGHGTSAGRDTESGPRLSEAVGPLTFTRLKWTSFFHSVVYLSLIVCAIAGLAAPTLVLGWTHGILWIVMSIVCIAAVRLRVIPLRLGVAVAVLGGLGPFVGSFEFVREQGRRAHPASPSEPPPAPVPGSPTER
ncbi:MAG TPA: hypothetical protein VKG62_08920 [Solirubrobacteraceae bacterium]|nr:hypothetical protein [Solirubrobacteraceae bacterium]